MVDEGKARRYDASNRRRQAADTQRRILAAAQELFVRDGYTATTMNAIAEHAGVAVQTVYASTRAKRDILTKLLDLAVSGRQEQVPLAASSRWLEIVQEGDPELRLALFTRLHTEICGREAPVFAVLADAAGSDAEIRQLVRDTAEHRYQDQWRLAESLRQDGRLRADLSIDRAADIVWTLASERTYLALVESRGWAPSDYERWLTAQLIAALLPSG
ncbi:AcrR family transcriptional regulator [Streptacidiphilus sp. MAP12-20]|uniref:TetR/AcrR family transcriptional regulator n=1 Tax=Streptacidiphilus sp. MAP12-20 TaxID=3156299 RepID=UPI003514900C